MKQRFLSIFIPIFSFFFSLPFALGGAGGLAQAESTLLPILWINAQSVRIVYGEDIPAFTVQYVGFQSGDNASILTGTLSFETNAAPFPDAGVYYIAPSGLTSDRYRVRFGEATLTVDKATQPAPEKGVVITYLSHNGVILEEVAGAEYSKDGGQTWQDSPAFLNLDSNRIYRFTLRYKADNYHLAGALSPVTDTLVPRAPLSRTSVVLMITLPCVSLAAIGVFVGVSLHLHKRKKEGDS